MSDQQTYRTRAEAFASQVSLPFGSYRWSGLSGDFSGKGAGASMDFQDHRDYAPGDDPRHINWQAYARSGNYILKQYQEEVSPTLDLILDLSPSMFFTEEKQQRTSELFYLLSSCAQRSGAQTNVHLITGDRYVPVTKEEVYSSQWTRHIAERADLSESKPPVISRIPLRAGSMRVLISEEPTAIIRPLIQGDGSLYCFVPFINAEMNPDWKGNYEFEDAETSERQSHKVTEDLLVQYNNAYRTHFSLWEESVRSAQGMFARIKADDPLEESLIQEVIPKKLLEYTT